MDIELCVWKQTIKSTQFITIWYQTVSNSNSTTFLSPLIQTIIKQFLRIQIASCNSLKLCPSVGWSFSCFLLIKDLQQNITSGPVFVHQHPWINDIAEQVAFSHSKCFRKSKWIFRRYLTSVLFTACNMGGFLKYHGRYTACDGQSPQVPWAVHCLCEAPKGHFRLKLYGHEGAYLITGSLHYFKQSSLIQTVYTGLTS